MSILYRRGFDNLEHLGDAYQVIFERILKKNPNKDEDALNKIAQGVFKLHYNLDYFEEFERLCTPPITIKGTGKLNQTKKDLGSDYKSLKPKKKKTKTIRIDLDIIIILGLITIIIQQIILIVYNLITLFKSHG